MEVKDVNTAIEFLKDIKIHYFYLNTCGDIEQQREIDNVISLLQQGEKFKAMWGELKYEINWHKPELPLFVPKLDVSGTEEYADEVLDFINNIEQKYFPKPKLVKKVITIEVEAKDKEKLFWAVNTIENKIIGEFDIEEVNIKIEEVGNNA